MKHSRNRYQMGQSAKYPAQTASRGSSVSIVAMRTRNANLTQTLDALKYPTETAVRKVVEPQLGALNSDTLGGKIGATSADLCWNLRSLDRLLPVDRLTAESGI
jgi:hypothetical protein